MNGCGSTFLWALLAAGPAALSTCNRLPANQPPAVTHAATDFKTADELLDALETADKGLQSLVAQVKYDRTFELQGDRQVRTGTLWFVADKPAGSAADAAPVKKFAVRFDKVWIGPTRRDEDKTYIFDGQWLMEKDGVDKYYLKKQVVGPGEHFDPLKIGQGPFVMPIGQRKADIAERYTSQLLPALDGLDAPADAGADDKKAAEEAKADVQGAVQLKLTPRGESADEDFAEIRLWYKRGPQGELLPRMARTVNRAGDVSCVLLINVAVQLAGRPKNEEALVPADVLDTRVPAGWEGSIQSWRKPGAAAGSAREGPDAGDK